MIKCCMCDESAEFIDNVIDYYCEFHMFICPIDFKNFTELNWKKYPINGFCDQ